MPDLIFCRLPSGGSAAAPYTAEHARTCVRGHTWASPDNTQCKDVRLTRLAGTM